MCKMTPDADTSANSSARRSAHDSRCRHSNTERLDLPIIEPGFVDEGEREPRPRSRLDDRQPTARAGLVAAARARFAHLSRQTRHRKKENGEGAGAREKVAFRHVDDHLLKQ